MRKITELHIVVDFDRVKCVQIMGPPDTHREGHELYLKITDLVKIFDKLFKKDCKKEKTVRIQVKEDSTLKNT
jgi:hypothetical protein